MKSEPEARVLRRAVTLVPALHRAASAVLKLAVVPAVVLVLVLVLVLVQVLVLVLVLVLMRCWWCWC